MGAPARGVRLEAGFRVSTSLTEWRPRRALADGLEDVFDYFVASA